MKSEQFPRMGPVSMMNAVILLFGANGPVFREKKMVFTFLCGMIDFGAIKSIFFHIFDLFLKILSADS